MTYPTYGYITYCHATSTVVDLSHSSTVTSPFSLTGSEGTAKVLAYKFGGRLFPFLAGMANALQVQFDMRPGARTMETGHISVA